MRLEPTGPQRRAILACFRLSSWDWVRLADLLRALATDSETLDAIGGCIAKGWLDYDAEFDVVRTNIQGRDAAGLLSGFPVFRGDDPTELTREERVELLRRAGWFNRRG